MLQNLKRWITTALSAAPKAPPVGLAPLRLWAEEREFDFRAVRGDGGAIVEGRSGAVNWRLEWGPAQRAYVTGFELRFRAELGFGAELQLLLINRHLQEAMERAVFDQYVEGVQTRIDDQTPPEMRWLVMFPKLTAHDTATVGDQFSAAGNQKAWLLRWLEGPLSNALAARGTTPEHPWVLMIGRGRLALRTECNAPDRACIEAWVRLFETALREARRAHQQGGDTAAPSAPASPWSASTMPSVSGAPAEETSA
jgi:hypothetical protein